MNIPRLKHLITILSKPISHEFNMDDWAISDSCGTACCALGLAAIDPEFHKQGLRLVYRDEEMELSLTPDFVRYGVKFGSNHNGNAAEVFFDLTFGQADYIFYPGSYSHTQRLNGITPRMVIERIKQVIKGEIS